MNDLVTFIDGQDLGVLDIQTPRAANILSVQVGSLEYAQDLGIDLAFFINESFTFQNDAFKSYLIETLANRGINVASVTETINDLYRQYIFNVQADTSGTGLIAG